MQEILADKPVPDVTNDVPHKRKKRRGEEGRKPETR
jgi:hypothetical protein